MAQAASKTKINREKTGKGKQSSSAHHPRQVVIKDITGDTTTTIMEVIMAEGIIMEAIMGAMAGAFSEATMVVTAAATVAVLAEAISVVMVAVAITEITARLEKMGTHVIESPFGSVLRT